MVAVGSNLKFKRGGFVYLLKTLNLIFTCRMLNLFTSKSRDMNSVKKRHYFIWLLYSQKNSYIYDYLKSPVYCFSMVQPFFLFHLLLHVVPNRVHLNSKIETDKRTVWFLLDDDTDFDLGFEGGKGGGCRVWCIWAVFENKGMRLGFGDSVLFMFDEDREVFRLLIYTPVSDIVFVWTTLFGIFVTTDVLLMSINKLWSLCRSGGGMLTGPAGFSSSFSNIS